MRIARYEQHGARYVGLVDDGAVRALPEGADVLALLATRPEDRAQIASGAGSPVDLDDVRLLTPLDPPTVRDCVTFEEHVEGMILNDRPDGGVVPEWYELPTFYFTNPYAMVATGEDVPVPPGCRALDFELEVAVVVGRAGRDLTPEQAGDHIAGFAIFNDWSARDLQAREMKVYLGPCKGKDFASTLGPWIVTADELEAHRRQDGRLDLDMRVTLNGEDLGGDTLANMGWPFEDLVAYASRGTWVRPGDIIGSGTCGSGCLAELWGRRGERQPPPLRPGDEVTMTVEALGSITNRIVAGAEAAPIQPALPARRRARAH